MLPIEEELAVAVGETGGGVDVELGEGAVDPVGGAFELGPVADRGLIDDEVGKGRVLRVDGVGPLGAVLLVDEGGVVAELLENVGEGRALCEYGLGLDADFVASGVYGIFGAGFSLVGDNPSSSRRQT